MKKLILALLVLVHFGAFAQLSDAMDQTQQNQRSEGHSKGDIFILPSLGLGTSYSHKQSIPPLSLNAEYGFHDMLSLGFMAGFSVGKSNNFQTPTGNYHWNYNYIHLAGRASFHWGRYLNLPPEIDLYGRLALGWRFRTSTWKDNNSGFNSEPSKESDFGLIAGIHAGGKYMFTDKLGAMLEIGHDNVANIQLGLAFRL